jgi:hypothetical protein
MDRRFDGIFMNGTNSGLFVPPSVYAVVDISTNGTTTDHSLSFNVFTSFPDETLVQFIKTLNLLEGVHGARYLPRTSLVPGAVLLSTSVLHLYRFPAGLPLFATGLGALSLLGWRRKRKLLLWQPPDPRHLIE